MAPGGREPLLPPLVREGQTGQRAASGAIVKRTHFESRSFLRLATAFSSESAAVPMCIGECKRCMKRIQKLEPNPTTIMKKVAPAQDPQASKEF